MVRLAARLGAMRNAHRILIGKPEGKRSPTNLRRTWEDIIKIMCVNWTQQAHDKNKWRSPVVTVMNLRVP